MRTRDKQHVGAVCGKRPAANRPGNDAGQIEYFYSGQRPWRLREFFRGSIADLVDAEQPQFRHGAAVGMFVPFGE